MEQHPRLTQSWYQHPQKTEENSHKQNLVDKKTKKDITTFITSPIENKNRSREARVLNPENRNLTEST